VPFQVFVLHGASLAGSFHLSGFRWLRADIYLQETDPPGFPVWPGSSENHHSSAKAREKDSYALG